MRGGKLPCDTAAPDELKGYVSMGWLRKDNVYHPYIAQRRARKQESLTPTANGAPPAANAPTLKSISGVGVQPKPRRLTEELIPA